jgi:DnaJ-class molecular chaperone
MIGFIQTEGKIFNLDTEEELTKETFEHETYGLIEYLNFPNTVTCAACLGTGLVDDEECSDCVGVGNYEEAQTVVSVENAPTTEGLNFNLPKGWNSGIPGGEEE